MYSKKIKIMSSLKNGYAQFYDREHPLVHANGCVPYHRHVASLKIGRWVTDKEQVHHIDENRLNNHPDNLLVMSIEEHSKLHHTSYKKKYTCPICNIEFFANEKSSTTYCSKSCKDIGRIKDRSITKEILDELIPKMSWVALGKMFDYSDNGIKKRARALGCIF